jgi:hypothetical protein
MDRFDLCGLPYIVHLSIDDVGVSLRWLCNNHPDSIWDMRFFGRLSELHAKYGAQFTLYCFYDLGGGLTFSDISDSYAKEFAGCADWLKFGFHSRNSEPFSKDIDWIFAFEATSAAIRRLGMGTTDILRLHYWKASQEQKHRLRDMGVVTLLYPNEDDRYAEEKYIDSGIVHRRTAICFEKMLDINELSLHIGNRVIAAFTHEKCFEMSLVNIEFALKIWTQNGYSIMNPSSRYQSI